MDIAKEQVLEMVKEELELLEGHQAFIAYAHLRAYNESDLNEGIADDIFGFFKQAAGLGLDTVTDVVKNKAASFILGSLGIPKDGIVNKAISEVFEQFSMEDWKKILAGEAKCPFIADKLAKAAEELVVGLVHEQAVKLLDSIYNKVYDEVGHLVGKFPDKKSQAVSAGLGLASKLPASVKAGLSASGVVGGGLTGAAVGTGVAVALSPLGSEFSQEAISNLPIMRKFRKQIAKKVCDSVSEFKSGNFNLPDLQKYIDK